MPRTSPGRRSTWMGACSCREGGAVAVRHRGVDPSVTGDLDGPRSKGCHRTLSPTSSPAAVDGSDAAGEVGRLRRPTSRSREEPDNRPTSSIVTVRSNDSSSSARRVTTDPSAPFAGWSWSHRSRHSTLGEEAAESQAPIPPSGARTPVMLLGGDEDYDTARRSRLVPAAMHPAAAGCASQTFQSKWR